MWQYAPYVDELKAIFSLASLKNGSCNSQIEAATNGEAKLNVCKFVPIDVRRQYGIFFTGHDIADKAAQYVRKQIAAGARVIDPTCGAGDLLLACSNYLPVSTGLRTSLSQWEQKLYGMDIHPRFVDATRLRLALKCIARTGNSVRTPLDSENLFPGVSVANALDTNELLSEADVVIANPPFYAMASPRGTPWGLGKVNSSAVFISKFLQQMKIGATLVAIIPDVLRSGSRYDQWRRSISESIDVKTVIPLERFDDATDVHVFILVATKTKRTIGKWVPFIEETRASEQTIQNYFAVSVGPVVDYREPKLGPWMPYLRARNLPTWETIRDSTTRRRFRGRAIKAPFVVVRRTSRPEDRFRAVGTIVAGNGEYAVENHLIILQPKDAKIGSCNALLEILKGKNASDFLNSVIRCRHLTVSAVQSIPWKSTLSA